MEGGQSITRLTNVGPCQLARVAIAASAEAANSRIARPREGGEVRDEVQQGPHCVVRQIEAVQAEDDGMVETEVLDGQSSTIDRDERLASSARQRGARGALELRVEVAFISAAHAANPMPRSATLVAMVAGVKRGAAETMGDLGE